MKPYRIFSYLLLAVMSVTLLGWVIHYGSYAAEPIPVINEICTNNFSVAATPNGEYLAYLELYNPKDKDYDMSGLWLSNNRNKPQIYDMTGITVPAHGYVILWMVDDDDAAETGAPDTAVEIDLAQDGIEDVTVLDCAQYYCNFDLSTTGDYIYISNSDSKIMESMSVPALEYNVSYGRSADGSGTLAGMTPTPGTSNNVADKVELSKVDTPVFSASSGFYDEAFELRIQSPPRVEVYYTLDGTTPTTESLHYEGPITIDDPSENENVYSAREDVYAGCYTPEDPVDKIVVVRAIAVNPATGATSNVVSGSYFVGYDEKSAYSNMAVVSLITDPDNLYDYDTGIYVMGTTYDEYLEKGGFTSYESDEVPEAFSDSSGDVYHRYTYTNSEHHGREWEREVQVQYYNADHELVFTQNAGMRVAGESSRHNPFKSLNLMARGIYGDKVWRYAFWNYPDVDTVRLRASAGEDLHWKETFVQSLCDGREVGIQHSIPVAVFMDGEYWGMYQLTEQYGEAYFKGYYDVNEEDLIIWKNNSIVAGDREQGRSDYDDIEEVITTYDMSQDHLYALAEERIDMDSLIDYFSAQIYLANVDIDAHHNQEMWKSSAEDDDNRWRYVLYDLDQTCYDASDNTIARYEETGTLYWPGYLSANEGFKEQYVTTLMDLANVEYSYQRVHALFANKAATLAEQSIETQHRYTDADYDLKDYNDDLRELDNFFRFRRHNIEQFLQEDLGLGEIAALNVTNNDVNGGAVTVNSSTLTPVDYDDDGSWTGNYFTDYTVTLTATPVEGYEFAGWSGDVESTEASITVQLTEEGVSVQAEFVVQQ